MNKLQNNLIDKIKTGEISMKPRWHFVLQAALLLLGVVIVSLLSIYLLSFVLFFLVRTGIIFASPYGVVGLSLFLGSSPWLLILLVVTFLLILYVLVKQYAFSYKQPFLYTLLGVVVLVVVISFGISQTPMHQRIKNFAEERNVPGFAPLYRASDNARPPGVIIGTIQEVSEDGFTLITDTNEILTVIITVETKFPRDKVFKVGEEVFVAGKRQNDEVVAAGIRPPPPTMRTQDMPIETGRTN